MCGGSKRGGRKAGKGRGGGGGDVNFKSEKQRRKLDESHLLLVSSYRLISWERQVSALDKRILMISFEQGHYIRQPAPLFVFGVSRPNRRD